MQYSSLKVNGWLAPQSRGVRTDSPWYRPDATDARHRFLLLARDNWTQTDSSCCVVVLVTRYSLTLHVIYARWDPMTLICRCSVAESRPVKNEDTATPASWRVVTLWRAAVVAGTARRLIVEPKNVPSHRCWPAIPKATIPKGPHGQRYRAIGSVLFPVYTRKRRCTWSKQWSRLRANLEHTSCTLRAGLITLYIEYVCFMCASCFLV